MPRRSTEWSTESSCTSVARWISSTTAASVTARGSTAPAPPPAAWWESRSSVGRNSLPFIRSRWSFTSAMIGKSAAMMRRSSPATRSSSLATERWMSRSATGATCWLTSLRTGQRLGARAHVHEPDVHRKHPPVQLARLDFLALLLQRPTQPVEDAEPLLVARGGQLQRAPQDGFGHHEGAFLDEAHAERLRALQFVLGRAQRLLQFGDRLVQETHLLEGDAEIVVGLEVGLVDVLVDPLLEARQHLLEVALLVAGRLFVGYLHPRVALGRLFFEDHRTQVHELGLGGRRVVAHLQLRVLRGGLPLHVPPRAARGPGRRRPCGHRGRNGREHRERGFGPLVPRVVLRHAPVDGV